MQKVPNMNNYIKTSSGLRFNYFRLFWQPNERENTNVTSLWEKLKRINENCVWKWNESTGFVFVLISSIARHTCWSRQSYEIENRSSKLIKSVTLVYSTLPIRVFTLPFRAQMLRFVFSSQKVLYVRRFHWVFYINVQCIRIQIIDTMDMNIALIHLQTFYRW